MNRWHIGDVTVTRVVESESAWKGTWLLPNATADNVKREADWLYPHFTDEEGRLRLSIHALVIESCGKRIVVDTCVGNDKIRSNPAWNQMKGSFLEDLAKAGFARESIDRVMCTHLHVDHVGWNTTLQGGRWVPTFPKARYLIGRTEWEFFSKVQEQDMRAPVEDSVRPVVEAGLVDLVESDHQITNEVRLEPTPGHTPGHVAVRISSRGQEAVITGDLMHHPIQCGHPDWGSGFDANSEQAQNTRRAFLERYSDKPILVIGTHFATPTAGHIVAKDSSWRFKV